jgi:hypothetical protein
MNHKSLIQSKEQFLFKEGVRASLRELLQEG